MSLEAIEKVTQAEAKSAERKAAAEAEAKQLIANAQRDGLALLQQIRQDAAQSGKALLAQAEAKAAERSAAINRTAQAEGDTLRHTASAHLDAAAEFIVGRVVNH
ncbi:MAG: hypothetical protein RR035_01905 [Oscillibacter sp.]